MSSTPGWDARAYDESFRFVSDHAGDLVALLDPQPGERILDLGCGTGRLAAAIAECGASVTGVDSDAAMIEAARAQFPAAAHPTLDFARADGEALAEAALAGPFDAVFSNAALHWMTRPKAVLRGLSALLRPGGRLVAELGGHGNVVTVEDALRDALEAEGVARERQPRPWYFPSLAEYAALLEQHGFEPRLMTLFDRPTTLEDGEPGMAAWLRMFGHPWLAQLSAASTVAVIARVEAAVRPQLWREDEDEGGRWVVDYRRLRLVAVRGVAPAVLD